MRVRFYDAEHRRLVYVTESATAEFWDNQWDETSQESLYDHLPRRSLVLRQTPRFVPSGGVVLEGGCGLAQNAWHLHRTGYRAIALDYVPRTLTEVQRRIPAVRPLRGDVRALPLADGSVDAYWSIGVIEHWYDGYGATRDEMARVLRPGGHLFLTFPYMSPLRRLRARLGTYPRWRPTPERMESFYQFALDHRAVTERFEEAGFTLVAREPFLGVSGLEEELPRGLAQWLDRTRGPGLLARAARTALAALSTRWASHCILLVLCNDGSGDAHAEAAA